ncbi:MAG: hypothetical protein WD001_00370 [Woeseia sp.]
MAHYGEEHQDMPNAPVYWIAVPLLVLGTVGLLWSLPVPAALTNITPLLNWGTVFLMAAMVYYFIISVPLAIGMLPFVFGILAIIGWLDVNGDVLPLAAAGLTVAAVCGLYAGHFAGRGLRGVGLDIQLMMIAPVWMLSILYRRLGIPH